MDKIYKIIESKDSNYKSIEDWIEKVKGREYYRLEEKSYFKPNKILSTKESSHYYEMRLTATKLN